MPSLLVEGQGGMLLYILSGGAERNAVVYFKWRGREECCCIF